MSGDQLRNFAVVGDFSELKNLLAGGANPCSVDEKGLTALHYAVWNGHLRCVEILVANHWGKHHETGEVCSSINLQSNTGYTALHIAVMRMVAVLEDGNDDSCGKDCNQQSRADVVIECCRLLVNVGADCSSLRDIEGKSALELAQEAGNEALASIFCSAVTLEEEHIQEFMKSIQSKHMVQNRRDAVSMTRDSTKNDVQINNDGKSEADDDWLVRFHKIGNFPSCRKDKLLIPKELDIHEHRILPYAKLLYSSEKKMVGGAMKIRHLVKVLDQANRNIDRREKLANSRTKGELQRIHI